MKAMYRLPSTLDTQAYGDIELIDNKIVFTGISRNFLLKRADIHVVLPANDVVTVEYAEPNTLEIKSVNGTIHLFKIGIYLKNTVLSSKYTSSLLLPRHGAAHIAAEVAIDKENTAQLEEFLSSLQLTTFGGKLHKATGLAGMKSGQKIALKYAIFCAVLACMMAMFFWLSIRQR